MGLEDDSVFPVCPQISALLLESFLYIYKRRAEQVELGEVKEANHGAKNDSLQRIHFVDHFSIQTLSFLLEYEGSYRPSLGGSVSEAWLVALKTKEENS